MDKETEDKMRREHFDKYEALAHALGIPAIVGCVEALGLSPADMAEKLKADVHLNNVPLLRWDGMDQTIRRLYASARSAGRASESGGWSLANSVCVAKHVARYHYALRSDA